MTFESVRQFIASQHADDLTAMHAIVRDATTRSTFGLITPDEYDALIAATLTPPPTKEQQ